MRSLNFQAEFNAQQLLFEVFSHILRIFDSVDPLSKSTFPFLYILIFQRWQSLESPSSIPGEHRHMCRVTFFLQYSMLNNFYLKHFLIWCVFLAPSNP